MKNPFQIDQCYVVSLAALTEICGSLSEHPPDPQKKRWWIAYPEHTPGHGYDFKTVTVHYNNPSGSLTNEISYTFPVVAELSLFGDDTGVMICLYSLAARSEDSSFYMENDELCHDDMADWEAFWFPIEAKLVAKAKR